MFLNTPAQSDLLAHLRAHWVGEDNLGQISLDGADPAASGQRADVHHQHLVLGQLLDLRRGTNGPVSQPSGPVPPQAALTLAAFLSPSVRTPSSLLSRK